MLGAAHRGPHVGGAEVKHCCDEFAKQAGDLQAPVGGGMLYPAAMRPMAQFESDAEGWNINGCCGGGCYVVSGMKFCPYCGTRLELPQTADQPKAGL
jgi:hypothetical protein